jgi:mannitol/fructose-specific phosphotransferase system IIA component (Ntr-type)
LDLPFTSKMTLADFTEPNLLVPELFNERQESTIAELSNRLKDAGRVKNARAFTRAVLKHESLVSTVFDEVAFSLARGHTATELSFAIGLSQYGIRWGKRKPTTVYAVVLFAVPASADGMYLSVLMAFSALVRDKLVFPELRHSKRSEEMFERLTHADVGETDT